MIDPEPAAMLKAWEERMKKRRELEAEQEAKEAERLRQQYEQRRTFKIGGKP